MRCPEFYQDQVQDREEFDSPPDYFGGFSSCKEYYLDLNSITPTFDYDEKVIPFNYDEKSFDEDSVFESTVTELCASETSFEIADVKQEKEKFKETFKIVSFLSGQVPLNPAVLKEEDTDNELELINEYVEEQLSNKEWRSHAGNSAEHCSNGYPVESRYRSSDESDATNSVRSSNRSNNAHPSDENWGNSEGYEGKPRYNLRRRKYYLSENGLIQKYLCQSRDFKDSFNWADYIGSKLQRSGNNTTCCKKQENSCPKSTTKSEELVLVMPAGLRYGKTSGTKKVKRKTAKGHSVAPKVPVFVYKSSLLVKDTKTPSRCKRKKSDNQGKKKKSGIVIYLRRNKFGQFTSCDLRRRESRKKDVKPGKERENYKIVLRKWTKEGKRLKSQLTKEVSSRMKSSRRGNSSRSSTTRKGEGSILSQNNVGTTFSKPKIETKKLRIRGSRLAKERAVPVNLHREAYRFGCSSCKYKCNTKNQLNIHLRRHNCDKPFCCTRCDYRSVEKSHLTRHMRLHTGERPHKCSKCAYASIQKVSLDCHIKRWH